MKTLNILRRVPLPVATSVLVALATIGGGCGDADPATAPTSVARPGGQTAPAASPQAVTDAAPPSTGDACSLEDWGKGSRLPADARETLTRFFAAVERRDRAAARAVLAEDAAPETLTRVLAPTRLRLVALDDDL